MAASLLKIFAKPKASKNEIVGWLGNELKIRIAAPPQDGEANLQLIEFLGEMLNLPKNSIHLAQGARSRHKLVEIPLEHKELLERLNRKLKGEKVGGLKKPGSSGS